MENLFFYSSKIIWMLVSPYSLFVLLLTISMLLLWFKKTAKARSLVTFLTLCTLLLSFAPIGQWMLYPLETRFQHNPELPDEVHGIIILGGSVIPSLSQEWQQLETNSFNERLYSFIELAKRYPEAKLVFTGGNGSLNPDRPTEADIIGEYLFRIGIDKQRLLLEKRARNTAENVSRTKRLVNPLPHENWVVITTAFHMPRSVGIFCQQHWPVIAYPVDHQTLPSQLFDFRYNLSDHANNLDAAMHEWLGLVAYFLTGKTGSILPQGCRQKEV